LWADGLLSTKKLAAHNVTGVMKVNQVFHYHPEKAQGARKNLLLELYQTLSQLGAYNPTISAAQREGSGHARKWMTLLINAH